MNKENLIRILDNLDKPVSTIEKDLKIPAGILAKAKSGKRNLPKKWDGPLLTYAAKFVKEESSKKYFTPANQPVLDKFGGYDGSAVVKHGNGMPVFDNERIQNRIDKLHHNEIKNYLKQHPWIDAIEKYCGTEGCSPQELIEAHRNQFKNKPFKKLKQIPVPSGEISNLSIQAQAIRKTKLGLD